MRGIRFESSTFCNIKNNYLLNIGTGINGLNMCDQTILCGNDMWNCMKGMDFSILLYQLKVLLVHLKTTCGEISLCQIGLLEVDSISIFTIDLY